MKLSENFILLLQAVLGILFVCKTNASLSFLGDTLLVNRYYFSVANLRMVCARDHTLSEKDEDQRGNHLSWTNRLLVRRFSTTARSDEALPIVS